MITRAGKADIDLLVAVHADAFPPHDAWSRDVFDMQLALPNVFALLHAGGGLIMVRLAADEAEILTLGVSAAARRSGIGRALLQEAVAMLAGLGVTVVFLEVSVANIAADALYTAAGFKQAGRRPHYYFDGSDALVLRLDIGLT